MREGRAPALEGRGALPALKRWDGVVGRCGAAATCRLPVLTLTEGAVVPGVKAAVAARQVTGSSSGSCPATAQEASAVAVPNHWVLELMTR